LTLLNIKEGSGGQKYIGVFHDLQEKIQKIHGLYNYVCMVLSEKFRFSKYVGIVPDRCF